MQEQQDLMLVAKQTLGRMDGLLATDPCLMPKLREQLQRAVHGMEEALPSGAQIGGAQRNLFKILELAEERVAKVFTQLPVASPIAAHSGEPPPHTRLPPPCKR
jgi:hypothetical protein